MKTEVIREIYMIMRHMRKGIVLFIIYVMKSQLIVFQR